MEIDRSSVDQVGACSWLRCAPETVCHFGCSCGKKTTSRQHHDCLLRLCCVPRNRGIIFAVRLRLDVWAQFLVCSVQWACQSRHIHQQKHLSTHSVQWACLTLCKKKVDCQSSATSFSASLQCRGIPYPKTDPQLGVGIGTLGIISQPCS